MDVVVFFLPAGSWLMRGRDSLTAHRKSCSGVPRRFRLFDLMTIKAENLLVRATTVFIGVLFSL